MSEPLASTETTAGPYFPRALLSVSRQEHYQQPLGLNIFSRKNDALQADNVDPSSSAFLDPKYWQRHSPQESEDQGPLPPALKGHVFIIGTAASFDSHPVNKSEKIYYPNQEGWQHIYSGDGMMYRLDFHTSLRHAKHTGAVSGQNAYLPLHRPGWAHLATRLVKTPDYYADEALETKLKYQAWPDYTQVMFKDAALTRLSLKLGGRNYLNTAWLPLKPKQGESERLLATWDAGRPYEIDPCSLGLLAPVGLNKDWKPVFDMTSLPDGFPILSQVFPMILATAHPVYDQHEDAVYLVNGTKSLKSMLQIPRLIPYFIQGFLQFLDLLQAEHEAERADVSTWADLLAKAKQTDPHPSLLDRLLAGLLRLVLWIAHCFISILSAFGIGGKDGLFLYRWRGQQTEIQASDKWEIVDERGWPIPILQSAHQMALTKDYIIISDSSFKFVVADVLPSLLNPQDLAQNLREVVNRAVSVRKLATRLTERLPIPTARPATPLPNFEEKVPEGQDMPEGKKTAKETVRKQLQFLFSFLNYAQSPYTDIYVVPRAALEVAHQADPYARTLGSHPPKVKAKHFRLRPETAHFLASYDNPDHQVVLHVGHIQGSDPAEFVNQIDQAVCNYSPDTNSAQPCSEEMNDILQARAGALANSLAPNHLGLWTLDMKTGRQQQVPLIEDDKFQLLAFFAFNEQTSHQVTDVYWNCGGAWPYHHTINHLDLYKHQIDPQVMDQQINQIAKDGRPANLLRVSQNTGDPGKIELEDFYAFPPGYYSSSPQFIPQDASDPSATEGYLVCVVVATDHFETNRPAPHKVSELWIFDAAQLSQGPLYRLQHPELNVGPTLHTAWLTKLEPPPSRVDYDVQEDYKAVLDQVEPPEFRKRVHKLFEEDVFPQVIHDSFDAIAKQRFRIRIFDASLSAIALQNIHHAIDGYASACGYGDSDLMWDEHHSRFRDIQYRILETLPSEQHTEIANTGVAVYQQRKSNSQVVQDPTLKASSASVATLLQTLEGVNNAVLLLGQLFVSKFTAPDQPSKTFIKVLASELQDKIDETPELLDSAQAMINFLFNRAELPDAIADSLADRV
ncbi:carotenoid oxygenase family protein [Acaryochloris sp. IP29b_bin.148]|uniref:carotenoid oxygenase family protein n=1 Tax=Acaryochloris sp. IP29b_bin.148 TaxID=2969218 RepID=UPI00262949E5|nr:carotenoid oxygenase family protein [Acaryochloris sp. IP29b_bin.148]